jgi:ribosomal protein S18 acetylase RimI-like enzyme
VALSIERATSSQLRSVAAVLARAFADDAMVRWPFGDVADVERRIEESFALLDAAVIDAGLLLVANACEGVAVWLDPAGLAQFEEIEFASRGAIHALMADQGIRYRRLWDWIASMMPDEPMWFLEHVGVDPQHQGRGVGAALVRHGLIGADEQRLPAVLETANARNLSFYESFGFRVFAEGDAPGDGPRIWFMRRDPTCGQETESLSV